FGRLLRQDLDFLLFLLHVGVVPSELLARRGEFSLDGRNLGIQLRLTCSKFTQLAFSRQDAALGVMSADGQFPIALEEFALKRHEAVAARLPCEASRHGEIFDDQRGPQQMLRQMGKLRMRASDQPCRRADESSMLWKRITGAVEPRHCRGRRPKS